MTDLLRKAGGGLLAVLLALAGAVPAASSGAEPPLAGSVANFTAFAEPRPIPAAGFVDGEGRPVSLADFRGRVVLVNFRAGAPLASRSVVPRPAELGGPICR